MARKLPGAGTRLSLVLAAFAGMAVAASCGPEPGSASAGASGPPGRSAAQAVAGPWAKPERETRGFSASVRSVKSERYYATHPLAGPKAGTPGLEFAGSARVEFDRRGYITRVDSYGADGAAAGTAEYLRDSRAFLVRERGWGADGSLEYDFAYEYDGRGRLVRERYADAAGADGGGYAYEYGDSEKPIRREALRPANQAADGRQYMDYVYDEAGRLVEERYYFESMGGLALSVKHAYRDGRLAFSSHYQSGRWLEFRVFYEYDGNGDPILEEGYQIPTAADPERYEAIEERGSYPIDFLISVQEHRYEYYE